MPTTRPGTTINPGTGTNIATVLPNANSNGQQQTVSLGDPDDGNVQLKINSDQSAQTRGSIAASATGSPSVSVSFGTATKANAKASSGNVVAIHATNQNTSARWLQVHNKASAPAGADVPVMSFQIPAGNAVSPGQLVLDYTFFGPNGKNLATGVGWALSTTRDTFTDSAAAADHDVNLLWV